MPEPRFEWVKVIQTVDGGWESDPDGDAIPLGLYAAYRAALKCLVEVEAAIYRECWDG